ncbi:MAG: hypothetical protein H6R05_409 [Burkholderiaceae bacterium]|nr:hypothetical protein [Burkholderiaceae bacterium]
MKAKNWLMVLCLSSAPLFAHAKDLSLGGVLSDILSSVVGVDINSLELNRGGKDVMQLDVAGIKIGMGLEQVKKVLEEKNFVIYDTNDGLDEKLGVNVTRQVLANSKDEHSSIFVWFTSNFPYSVDNTIVAYKVEYGIGGYDDIDKARSQLVGAALEKYGSPSVDNDEGRFGRYMYWCSKIKQGSCQYEGSDFLYVDSRGSISLNGQGFERRLFNAWKKSLSDSQPDVNRNF